MRSLRSPAVLVALAMAALAACESADGAVPDCDSGRRLAVVAQSVPTASYVPCVAELAAGWEATGFEVRDGGTAFSLVPDRPGGRPVRVRLLARCDVSGAVPTRSSAEGIRSFTRLASITPRFEGARHDVFAGGCLSYEFDFDRGPHIALMEELEQAIDLLPRRELRLVVRRDLGLELDP